MPTPQQLKVRKELEQQLARKGIAMELINTPAPRAQWWKPMGNGWVKMPNLLPADAYHTQLYMGKGMPLIPPETGDLVPYAPTAEQAKAYGIPIRGVARVSAPPAPITEDKPPVADRIHRHRYVSEDLGARCSVEGCAKTREEPFKGRSK